MKKLIFAVCAIVSVAACDSATAPKPAQWCSHYRADTLPVAFKGDTVHVVISLLEWYDCAKGWPQP